MYSASTQTVRCAFFTPPRSEQLTLSGAWWAHPPRWAVCLNHFSGPSHLVSRVHCKNTISGVLCVSSGELISGLDSPGSCQKFRIPGRCGQQLGACSQFVWGCQSLGMRLPLVFWLWLLHSCLSASGPGGGACMQPISPPSIFAQSFVLWVDQAVY